MQCLLYYLLPLAQDMAASENTSRRRRRDVASGRLWMAPIRYTRSSRKETRIGRCMFRVLLVHWGP